MFRFLSLLCVLVLVGGCSTLEPIRQADTAARDRIDQIAKEVDQVQGRLDETVGEALDQSEMWRSTVESIASRYEKLLAEQSERWATQSTQWNETLTGFRQQGEKESALWRKFLATQNAKLTDESRLWRELVQAESEKTRETVKSLPAMWAQSAGVPTKQGEDGASVVDWAGVAALVFTVGKTAIRSLKERAKGELQREASSPA